MHGKLHMAFKIRYRLKFVYGYDVSVLYINHKITISMFKRDTIVCICVFYSNADTEV